MSTSPNLRYGNNGHLTADSSEENKLSNFGLVNNEQVSQKESGNGSDKLISPREDSIWEYKDTDSLLLKPTPKKLENLLFSVKIDEDRFRRAEEVNLITQNEKEYIVHPKLEFITAQLPLHSISEDVNSPYFASSPSNLTAYIRRQSTPNKENSTKTYEPKFSTTTELNEDAASVDKHLGGNTITTISDNDFENAPIDNLETKLNKIMQKRAKRIEIFENYLNEWDKQKSVKAKSVTPKTTKPRTQVTNQKVVNRSKSKFNPPPMTRSKPCPVASRPKSITKITEIKTSKSIKVIKKVTPSLYLSKLNPNKITSMTSPILRKVTVANGRCSRR